MAKGKLNMLHEINDSGDTVCADQAIYYLGFLKVTSLDTGQLQPDETHLLLV